MNGYRVACVLAAMAAGCGTNAGGGAAPDAGGTPSRPADTRASRPATTVENPGEPEPPTEDLPADEAAAGDVAEGTDAVGACYITSPAGLNARLCVDYNDGYDADSAGEHCRAQSGTFNAGQGCDRSNARLVGNCALTEMMRARVAYAYRIPATRAMPDPPTLDAAEVTAWCQTQMGTAPAQEAPTNTGRCVYRTSENFLAVSGVMARVNYDQGFTEAEARANCAGRTASTGSPTFAEQSLLGRRGVARVPLRDGEPELDDSLQLALPLVSALGRLDVRLGRARVLPSRLRGGRRDVLHRALTDAPEHHGRVQARPRGPRLAPARALLALGACGDEGGAPSDNAPPGGVTAGDDPCMGVPEDGRCTAEGRLEYCVVPTDIDDGESQGVEVASVACGAGERCAVTDGVAACAPEGSAARATPTAPMRRPSAAASRGVGRTSRARRSASTRASAPRPARP